MKQTVCSFCHGLLEEPFTEKHIQQYQHVIQMSQVEPSEYPTTTTSQLTGWMLGGALRNTPRLQAVEHKGLLLYPVQIIINLTVYETHFGGEGRWTKAYTRAKITNVHPVRNLNRGYKESSAWPDAHSRIVKGKK